jgi:enoyl-CoA hydratase/carnithine racemase
MGGRYPMPTIALINGHAFAGGFMIAMYHDYRIQNPKRGFLCLNEIALGIPLTPPMRSIFMTKIQDGALIRSMILEGKRFTAQEALEGKIVDRLGELPEAIEFAQKRGLLKIGSSPSFVALKERLWAGVLDSIDNLKGWDEADEERAKRSVASAEEGKVRVQNWEGKSKL